MDAEMVGLPQEEAEVLKRTAPSVTQREEHRDLEGRGADPRKNQMSRLLRYAD